MLSKYSKFKIRSISAFRYMSFLCVAIVLPVTAHAQTLLTFMQRVTATLARLVPLLIAVALIAFLWGVFKYVRQADDENAREEGINLMINGLVALFIMTSLWGFIALLNNTVFGNNSNTGNFLPDTSNSSPNTGVTGNDPFGSSGN